MFILMLLLWEEVFDSSVEAAVPHCIMVRAGHLAEPVSMPGADFCLMTYVPRKESTVDESQNTDVQDIQSSSRDSKRRVSVTPTNSTRHLYLFYRLSTSHLVVKRPSPTRPCCHGCLRRFRHP
ncbi:unnamed protein product [Ectocarpus sp. 8 AP-2014]